MNAHCIKCRRPLKDGISKQTLVKATEARLRGCIVSWTCKETLPNGRTCGGIITGVEELVNPLTIKSPVKLFKPKKEIITVN